MKNQGLGRKEIQENYYEPLSNYDLDNLSKEIKNKKANWIKYSDIKNGNIQNLRQLFKNYNYCILFVDNPDKRQSVGHWVMTFFNNPNEANFFDSYGTSIQEICPKLIPLLGKQFRTINSNSIKYQKYGDRSATCGRHCLMNVGLMDLNPNHNFDFLYNTMEHLKKKYRLKDYNEVVSKFIDEDL